MTSKNRHQTIPFVKIVYTSTRLKSLRHTSERLVGRGINDHFSSLISTDSYRRSPPVPASAAIPYYYFVLLCHSGFSY